MLNVEEIDSAVLGASHERWRKTARVIVVAEEALRKAGVEVSIDDVAKRLYLLVRQGRLEGAGKLSLWRHSEVRLPAAGQTADKS